MNIFLGLSIPPQDVHTLTDLLIQAHPEWQHHHDIRWTAEHDHHLTLHFFGSIDPDSLAELIAHLPVYIQSLLPFHIRINQVFNFPKPGSDLVAAYVQLNAPLAKLYRQVAQAVQEHRFPVESRAYLPHITLCRAKRRHTLTMEPLTLSDYTVTLSDLTLYQTQPRAGGNRYIPLHRWI